MSNKLEVALTKKLCIICGKEMEGDILFNSVFTENAVNKVKSLHNKIVGYAEEPCDECKIIMEEKFILIIIDEEKSDMDHLPECFFRTGEIYALSKSSGIASIYKEINPHLDYGFMDINYLKELSKKGMIKYLL